MLNLNALCNTLLRGNAMKNITLFIIFLFSILQAMAVSAESISTIKKNGEFNICAHKNALPFSNEEEATGMHIDLAQLIADELRVSLKTSWINLPRYAKFVKCDAYMGAAILPGEGEGEGFVKKTNPYAQIEILAITNSKRQLKTLDDFNGLRVATTSGSLIHMALLKQDTEIFVSHLTDKKILDALINGDVDVGIVANSGWGWYKKNNSDTTANFHSQSTKFINSVNAYQLGIGFRKADKDTIIEANKILYKIKARGDLAKLLDKYGLEPVK